MKIGMVCYASLGGSGVVATELARALANTIARVADEQQLDIVHAHYAVPHATAAYLADQMLHSARGGVTPTRTVTTLHGTDITLVGSDPSYAWAVGFRLNGRMW